MATNDSLMWQALLAQSCTKPSERLEDLLRDRINIREGIRSLASTSQQNLREFLQGECRRDASFPPILRTKDKDFLGGSFARHTKIHPLDDIDIYLPMDGAGLFYYFQGVQQPYTVLSDGLFWNPLLTPRWAVGQLVSSSKVITGFAAVLQRRFPQTSVKSGGQAVSIRMTHGETSNTDGLGYDVVPCFSLQPHNPNERHFYLIPDGNGGWIRTNPKIDAVIADILQEDHNRIFRKVVKLVKYWNSEHLGGKLNSYFLELSIARVFLERAVNSESVAILSYGVALGFWAVQQAVSSGVQQSWIASSPPVHPGTLLSGDQILLQNASAQACAAWEDEKANLMFSAAEKWESVFGDDFRGR